MTPDEAMYARIHAILDTARTLYGAKLETYLESVCGDDAPLRSRILELLAAAKDDGAADAFAEENLLRSRRSLENALGGLGPDWLPEKIGDYTILRQIGQGGMGVVYEAEQDSPRRRVAIKLLHPMHANRDRMRRFRREAELLGRLQHPGIAQIFEAGTYDVGRGPQPFFAMELVDGIDVRTYCDRHALDRSGRIDLLARIADAVHYAHERGVIHRDLKPDNVLVDRDGLPRILDFGIARANSRSATLSTIVTEEGQMVGTLSYMAPEQLRDSSDAVTVQVDVYALGVLGFELLVGRLPYDTEAMSLSQAIAHLATSEAPRAGSLDPGLRGDVEIILGTALESDRDRRYRTAAALAIDLRRHQENRPIQARAPSRVYLVRKFVRRHRALVGGVCATLVVAIVGAFIAVDYAIEANRRADALERANYIAGMEAAASALDRQDYDDAAGYLFRAPEAHRGWEYAHLSARLERYTDEWPAPAAVVTAPVFSSDGRRMYAMLLGGSLATWDAQTGALLRTRSLPGILAQSDHPANDVLLNGPSERYATISRDGDIVIGDLESGRPTETLHVAGQERPSSAPPRVLGFNGDGQRLLYFAGDTYLWDSDRPVGTRSMVLDAATPRGTLNSAGTRFVGQNDREIVLSDAATSEPLCRTTLDDSIVDFAFSPDDKMLAAAGYNRNLYLLDGDTLQTVGRLTGHQGLVFDVSWTNDGSRVISTSMDGTLRIWDPRTSRLATTYVAGVGPHRIPETGPPPYLRPSAAATPDGRSVIVAGERLRRFPLRDPTVLRGHNTFVYGLAFSPDGSLLASSGFGDPDVFVWSLWNDDPPWVIRAHSRPRTSGVPLAAFSKDGTRLVVNGNNHISNWDVQGRTELPVSTDTDPSSCFLSTLGDGIWGPDPTIATNPERTLLAHCQLDVALLYDHFSTADMHGLAFYQRGRLFPDGDPTPIARLAGHSGTVYCVAFSPDGSRIATGGNDATVRIWDADTHEQLVVLRGHTQYVMYIAFSPDGTLLASASGDTTVRLWDTLTPSERRARSRSE